MAISERSRHVHEELFPDHTSTRTPTDPELIELFDDSAFDEVIEHSAQVPRRSSTCEVKGHSHE
jgi:hypothetical protein